MGGRALKSILKAFKPLYEFWMLLVGTKDAPSLDPAARERAQAAKTVGEAMHATKGNSGFSPFGASERVLGKELRDGHKRP